VLLQGLAGNVKGQVIGVDDTADEAQIVGLVVMTTSAKDYEFALLKIYGHAKE